MANNNPVNVESQENVNGSVEFFNKNAKLIIVAVVAVLVLIVGCIAAKNYYFAPRQDKASTALAKAQDLFAQEQYQKALDGEAGFLKVIEEYGSTDAGNLANLYAGLCYANLEKWQEAEKYLDAYSTKGDALVSPAAVAALGNAYAHLNQLDKAVSNLKKAASMADKKAANGVNESMSPSFLLQAAVILESQNKADEALKVYNDIKAKYPSSQLVGSKEIDKYIERLSQK